MIKNRVLRPFHTKCRYHVDALLKYLVPTGWRKFHYVVLVDSVQGSGSLF
jgi:hypothetical protein